MVEVLSVRSSVGRVESRRRHAESICVSFGESVEGWSLACTMAEMTLCTLPTSAHASSTLIACSGVSSAISWSTTRRRSVLAARTSSSSPPRSDTCA